MNSNTNNHVVGAFLMIVMLLMMTYEYILQLRLTYCTRYHTVQQTIYHTQNEKDCDVCNIILYYPSSMSGRGFTDTRGAYE